MTPVDLKAGRVIGRYRLGPPVAGPEGFECVAIDGQPGLELILPGAQLRLRAGARQAWELARDVRRSHPVVTLAEVAWVEVDGWGAWIRPRCRPQPELERLDAEGRAALGGWLVSAGVDLDRASADDLVTVDDGVLMYAPLGLAVGRLKRPITLAILLGAPGPAPDTPPRLPPAPLSLPVSTLDIEASGPARVRSEAIAVPMRVPQRPPALVIVRLPPGDPVALARVAVRTATPIREIERAAQRPGSWVWAPAADPAAALRLKAQAERAGLVAEIVSTEALSVSFLPAMVAAGLAQLPVCLSTGFPMLDGALVGALAVTAIASFLRAFRRLGPARRSARAVGAWETWTRSGRAAGPERALLALELRTMVEPLPGQVGVDVAEALDRAWTALFAAAAGAEREASGRIEAAAIALHAALDQSDAEGLLKRVRDLGG